MGNKESDWDYDDEIDLLCPHCDMDVPEEWELLGAESEGAGRKECPYCDEKFEYYYTTVFRWGSRKPKPKKATHREDEEAAKNELIKKYGLD